MLAPSSLSTRAPSPVVVQNRYQVVRALGSGAQATVFLAFDLALRQWRALKLAAPGLSEVWHARFMREAQLMARLSHPNVVKIYDVLAVAGTPALVTELARAGSVAAWMHRHGRLPAVLAAQVAAQCASALAHAHAEGVLHRDVKPGNVLLHADGSAAVADFGIARFANDNATALTEVGWVLGTLAFMAPEQRRGIDQVGPSADIYALGATLYTMCTARRETELFLCVDRPSMLEGIPEAVADVIRGCCRYEAADRLPTMAAVRDALVEAARRCPPAPAGTPPLASAAITLPDLPPPSDPRDAEVEALRARLRPSLLSEQETEDTGMHDLFPQAPHRASHPERRETVHLPDPWDDDEDPTSLPPYVEKLYPRNLSMPETRVVGLPPPEPTTEHDPAAAPSWRFALVAGGIAVTVAALVGAMGAAWHETERTRAVVEARADLVDLVVDEGSLVRDLELAGAAPGVLAETRDALDRATHRESHLAAVEVAERLLEHRDGIVLRFPDDAKRLVRLQGVLDTWRDAETCWFPCGRFRSGRASDGRSRGT